LEDTITYLHDELAQLQEKVNVSEEKLASMQEDLSEKERQVQEQLEATLAEGNKNPEIAELTDTVDNLQFELAQAQALLQDKDDRIHALQEDLQKQELTRHQQAVEGELEPPLFEVKSFPAGEEGASLELKAELKASHAQVAELTQHVQEIARKYMLLEDENATLQQRVEDSQGDLKAKLANMEILLAQKEALIADLQSGFTVMRRDAEPRKTAETSAPSGSDRQVQTLTEECERWKAKFEESEVKQVQLYNEIQKLEAQKAALMDPLHSAPPAEASESKKRGKLFKRGEDKPKK
jgi:chromosome segregation ATPase